MKKIVIVGGGIAGMTAGILLQKVGFETAIYEKNALPGGQCTAWKREGYTIDNCIHWLTGSRSGSGLHELWKETGALGDGVEIYQKEMFYSSKLNGETLTFWRDKERTRREMLALSPEDEVEINKLMKYVQMAESMSIPTEKPFDAMNLFDYMKLGLSMKDMGAVMKEYGNMDIRELAQRFHHPLIQRAITDYMPPGYQAYAFIVSYATITGGNGDIPRGGSLAMSLRMADRYKALGGSLYTGSSVKKVRLSKRQAEGIQLENGMVVNADYVICACDTDYTFGTLLDQNYMPKELLKQYTERKKYPVGSGFQIAYAVEGTFPELTGTRLFSCEEMFIGTHTVNAMSVQSYSYEPEFAPVGNTILQSNIVQTEADYAYWEKLYKDAEAYCCVKKEKANEAMNRLIAEYPFLSGKIRILDIWTPATYHRYCNSYKGAYMSFVITKKGKDIRVASTIKGIENVYIASQWQMGPGGLPTAAVMGKFAAWRIINHK